GPTGRTPAGARVGHPQAAGTPPGPAAPAAGPGSVRLTDLITPARFPAGPHDDESRTIRAR
ncbi:hypothetical protein, partial [Cellulomonas algicola]|uniref:hypothetical protein n=1 Tax=Cellulomonas algicola TaxID=2071633 RepID=UPI001B355F67